MNADYYQLARKQRIHRLRAAARDVVSQYDVAIERFTLIPSAFPVFRVEARSGERFMLKFARGMNEGFDQAAGSPPVFHPPSVDFRLQMLWLEALSRDTDLTLQTPLRNRDGELITQITIDGLDRPTDAIMCSWIPGRIFSRGWRPRPWPSATTIRKIARVTATLHNHAESWTLPSEYERPTAGWQSELTRAFNAIVSCPYIKDVSAGDLKTVELALADVLTVMDGLGVGRNHFGVIHEDLCPQNLILHKGQVSPIDFGNAVFGYYLWDMVHTLGVSYALQKPFWPRHRAYIDGYREIRPLPRNYRRIISAMFVTFGIVETAYETQWPNAVTSVPKIKLPRAVWIAERFLSGEKFLDM